LALPDVDALLEIAEWCSIFQFLEKATSICAALLSVAPDHVDVLGLAGLIDLRMGRIKSALSVLDRAAKLDPWEAAIRYRYGIALLLHDRVRDSEVEFYAAALADPSHEAARYRLRELGSRLPLPDGLRLEDTLARRPKTTVGTVGEIGFPIALPMLRHGHKIIFFEGQFRAVPQLPHTQGQQVAPKDPAVPIPMTATLSARTIGELERRLSAMRTSETVKE